jgi:hypothetical protein
MNARQHRNQTCNDRLGQTSSCGAVETERLATTCEMNANMKSDSISMTNLQPSTSLYKNVTLADASSTMADMCMGVASDGGISETKLWKCVLMSAAHLLWFNSFCKE